MITNSESTYIRLRDMRGIDVGIMTKAPYEIIGIVSHVDDVDGKGTIFSRDCAEYEIKTQQGEYTAGINQSF